LVPQPCSCDASACTGLMRPAHAWGHSHPGRFLSDGTPALPGTARRNIGRPGTYLTSVTSIPDTANLKETPWPTLMKLMMTPLSFRMDLAPAPPPTTAPALIWTYFPAKSSIFFRL